MLMSWLSYAGHKLIRLGHSSYDASAWDIIQTSPSELAIAAGVKSAGFSRERFGFWLKRMGELGQNEEEVVKAAFQRCYHLADKTLKEVDDHRA